MKKLTGRTCTGETSETPPPLPYTHCPTLERKTVRTDRPSVTAGPLGWVQRGAQETRKRVRACRAELRWGSCVDANEWVRLWVCMCVWCWTGSCGPLEERKINTHPPHPSPRPHPPAARQVQMVGAQRRDPSMCPHLSTEHQMLLWFHPPPKKVSNWRASPENRGAAGCPLWNCEGFKVFFVVVVF